MWLRMSGRGWSNDGLYWIDPNGKIIEVNDLANKTSMGHEEWANKVMNMSLEKLLKDGSDRGF